MAFTSLPARERGTDVIQVGKNFTTPRSGVRSVRSGARLIAAAPWSTTAGVQAACHPFGLSDNVVGFFRPGRKDHPAVIPILDQTNPQV